MIKVLFLIHDLGQGGAEKVLVNLVNNMDHEKFDVTVMTLFGGGVNEQFLSPMVKHRSAFARSIPGNTKIMKLFSPESLHKLLIHEHYDVEISYLEGPSARVISGCADPDTKLISWIHVEQHTLDCLSQAFRNHNEAKRCYNRFDQTICVSEYVKNDFKNLLSLKKPCCVLYNTVESDKILSLSEESAPEISQEEFSIISVGTLKEVKGHDRLIRMIDRFRSEEIKCRLYILGKGPQKEELEQMIASQKLEQWVTLLGYHTNPYKFVRNAKLFACASHAEGFSTAATEALIVGTPVCTVEVSGMKEMLGENNEYGVVVPNDDDALYFALKQFLTDTQMYEKYKKAAQIRGRGFQTEETVQAVEEMITNVMNGVTK